MNRGIYNNLTLSIILGQLHTRSALISNNLRPLQAVPYSILSLFSTDHLYNQPRAPGKKQNKTKSHLWPIPPPHPSTLSVPLTSNSSASSGPFSSPSLRPLLIKASSSLSQDFQGGLHTGLLASTLTPFLSTLHTVVRKLFPNCKSGLVILSPHLKPSHGSLWH